MIHTRRQIELNETWAAILTGKVGVPGPERVSAGPGVDMMNIPLPNGEAEVYERPSGGGWKVVPFVGQNVPHEIENAQPLRSQKAYWDAGRPDVIAALTVPPEAMSRADLVQLVRELDRRFMQLADKVAFEGKYGLVDYTKVSVGSPSAAA